MKKSTENRTRNESMARKRMAAFFICMLLLLVSALGSISAEEAGGIVESVVMESVSTGSDSTGSDSTGSDSTGSDSTGSDSTGSDSTNNVDTANVSNNTSGIDNADNSVSTNDTDSVNDNSNADDSNNVENGPAAAVSQSDANDVNGENQPANTDGNASNEIDEEPILINSSLNNAPEEQPLSETISDEDIQEETTEDEVAPGAAEITNIDNDGEDSTSLGEDDNTEFTNEQPADSEGDEGAQPSEYKNAIQQAVDAALQRIDSETRSITIQVEAGEYDGDIKIQSEGKLAEFALNIVAANGGSTAPDADAADGEEIMNAADGSVKVRGNIYIDGIDVVLAGLYLSLEKIIQVKNAEVTVYGTAENDGIAIEVGDEGYAKVHTC